MITEDSDFHATSATKVVSLTEGIGCENPAVAAT
jgi:hypothetical protein